MKVYIDTDERYPDYIVSDREGGGYTHIDPIEVDEETFARWKAIEDAYDLRHEEIREAVERARRQA